MSPITWKKEWKPLALFIGIFILSFHLPLESRRFLGAVTEALQLLRWYAREHVILCLIPAFFIAGAIAVFISKGSVMKYLGAGAKKIVAYSVASVSGSVLAVCSCTVLPLFAGIYRMGAGLGPASAFLYSGPAINVLAIILTARVLGMELGIARAVSAVAFSIIIGLSMHFIFLKEEKERIKVEAKMPDPEPSRPLWKNGIFLAVLVGIMIFPNWSKSGGDSSLWNGIHSAKWALVFILFMILAFILKFWIGLKTLRVAAGFAPAAAAAVFFPSQPLLAFGLGAAGLTAVISTDEGESGDWFDSTWGFAKQILPLLFVGVLIAGALLGRPGHEGLIPSHWISSALGGNSFASNFFASVAGAFMYFATLTEIPILQGLLGNGMGKGPALALLLAGPALSLPNMLVIRSIMGAKKTIAFILLVIVLSTTAGLIYGGLF